MRPIEFYAAVRDDQIIEHTIATSYLQTSSLAYEQAYEQASQNNGPDDDLDLYIHTHLTYHIQTFQRDELIDAIKRTQCRSHTFIHYNFDQLPKN